jgi:phosphoribosyl 1,2-cyclic phosphodiesterase
MMRFALGSGSEGNSLLIEAGDGASVTRVLLDCGFGIKETARRLERLGVAPEQLDAVLVTHEHGDHVGSAYAFAARHKLPVHTSHGTWLATSHMRGADVADVRVCCADHSFSVGGLQIHPYTVPHDAREPLQFVLTDGDARLGVLTDAGMETPYVTARLAGVHSLVLECNHDRRCCVTRSIRIRSNGASEVILGIWQMTLPRVFCLRSCMGRCRAWLQRI